MGVLGGSRDMRAMMCLHETDFSWKDKTAPPDVTLRPGQAEWSAGAGNTAAKAGSADRGPHGGDVAPRGLLLNQAAQGFSCPGERMPRPGERGDIEIHPIAAPHDCERLLALLGMSRQRSVTEADPVG